jgi:hypothetical protein
LPHSSERIESGLITNANESAASIPDAISPRHSAVAGMSSQSAQTSLSRAASASPSLRAKSESFRE